MRQAWAGRPFFIVKRFTLYNQPMEAKRVLRRVGHSVALTIPSELLAEAGMKVDDEVTIRSGRGTLEVTAAPPGLDPEFVEWVYRHVRQYEEAYRELSKR